MHTETPKMARDLAYLLFQVSVRGGQVVLHDSSPDEQPENTKVLQNM